MPRLLQAVVVVALLVSCASASATVLTSTRVVEYTPTTNTSVFAVPFPFLSAEHLKVTKTLVSSGAKTVLVQGADYSVTLPRGSANGSITTTASVGNGFKLTIERIVPITQPTSFKTQGAFSPKNHEDALDRLTMIVQQLADGDVAASDITEAIEAHEGAADPHPNYALLPGRAGGQHLSGGTGPGESLRLSSTSHSTKGLLLLSENSVFDEAADWLGIGVTPTVALDVYGEARFRDTLGIGGDTLLQYGSIYKGGDDSFLGLYTATPMNASTGARLELHGAGSPFGGGSLNGVAMLYGSTIHFVDEEGTGRFRIDSTGIVGSSGLSIELDDGHLLAGEVRGSDASSQNLVLTSTTHATKGKILLGSSSAYDEATGRLGVGTTNPSAELHVIGDSVLAGDVYAEGRLGGRRLVQAYDGPPGGVVLDCRGIFTADASVSRIDVLDASDPQQEGCELTFLYVGADGDSSMRIFPDAGEPIIGTCVGSSGVVTFSGVAGKYVSHKKLNSKKGDYIRLVDVGSAWYVLGCVGDWESET